MSQADDAHEVALEWLKQLITLSSGIIVFSGTLAPLVAKGFYWPFFILGGSWVLFVASIVLCLEVISAITYSRLHSETSWSEGKHKVKAFAAKWCFISGLVIFVVFAGVSIYTTSIPASPGQATPTPTASISAA